MTFESNKNKNAITVVRGGWVLTYSEDKLNILKDHDVVIVGDEIHEIVPGRFKGNVDVEIDATSGIVMPGFINLHTHSDASLHGTTVDLYPPYDGGIDSNIPIELDTVFLYSIFFPLGNILGGFDGNKNKFKGVLSEDEKSALVRLALLGLIKGGSTTIVEMCSLGAELFAEAALEFGARTYVGRSYCSVGRMPFYHNGKVVYDENNSKPFEGLECAIELHKKYDGAANGRIKTILAPHATDTCNLELLRATRETADKLGSNITIHLAQGVPEMNHIREKYNMTPVEYLQDVKLLGSDLIAAHGVYTNRSDRALLKKTDTTIVHCTTSFAKGGIFLPLKHYIEEGVNVGVGTDSFSVDYLIELRTGAFLSKVVEKDPYVATAHNMIKYGTLNGAKALNRSDLGRISPGAKADLIVVNLSGLHNAPVLDPLRKAVYLSSQKDIETVIIDGQVIIENGKFKNINEAEIIKNAIPAFDKVWGVAKENGLFKL
ncbi:MAG: amidohydrolase family protein [Bacillota bacterium]|jgi:cytosine/adenosine deaminase-related metal-dependent hydrolase